METLLVDAADNGVVTVTMNRRAAPGTTSPSIPTCAVSS